VTFVTHLPADTAGERDVEVNALHVALEMRLRVALGAAQLAHDLDALVNLAHVGVQLLPRLEGLESI
jgi:hypothetical protein